MTLYELRTEIENLVDLESETLIAMIPDLINDAVRVIAHEPGIILPSLKVIQTVDTVVDQAYTTLPTPVDTNGFDGKLLFASVGGYKVDASVNLEDLLNAYPSLDSVGDVEAVALEGQTVWYAKIPEAATSMTLLLYQNPNTLTAPTDTPDCIPQELQRRTIVYYVAKQLFDYIEQDSEGKKPNMLAASYQYDQGITRLREYLAARRRGMSRSIWNV